MENEVKKEIGEEIEKSISIITIDWLKENYPKLAKWMLILKREVMKYVLMFRNGPDSIYLKLYTNEHTYCISASVKNNYLGCTMVTRKARTGETHNRGNDLADGDYTETTWNKILKDIIRCELKKLEVI